MPITDWDDYLQKLSEAQSSFKMFRAHGNVAARFSTNWTEGFDPVNVLNQPIPPIPSAPVALTKDSHGAFPFLDAEMGKDLYLARVNHAIPYNENAYGLLVYDRLSHMGGLSGFTNAVQTTNLPTAALPRHTSGLGVCIAVEAWSSFGGGTTNDVVVSYTNHLGVSGRSTIPMQWPASNVTRRVGILPLASGDLGVRSVESFQINPAGTSAGNIGIALIKPVVLLPGITYSQRNNGVPCDLGRWMLAKIPAGACLGIYTCSAGGGNNVNTAILKLIEVPQ